MNIFFGKISGKFDTNQIEEGYYKSDKGSSWFGSMKIGDYAYIIGGDKIQFWRAREWGEKDGVECLWFDILNNDLGINVNKFTALNFFKVTTKLVVLSSRSARNKAFFKLELLSELDIDYLSNSKTYEDDSLYRKIMIHKDKTLVNEKSKDLQFYYENEELKFFTNDFTEQKIISNYRDNLDLGGNGAVRKDNVIKILQSKKLNPSAVFTNEEISMRSIYDTLFCEYKITDKSVSNPEKPGYWLFAPGENASAWDEFYELGIMALGWDDIGDLMQYTSRDDIRDALRNAYGGEGDKKNDVSANDDFANKMSVNDIVIVKKGRRELLGYGVVVSDYYYDENRNEYKSCRRVDWKLRGNWKTDHNLVLKTLTEITQYSAESEAYDKYHERLMAIMQNKTVKKPLNMSTIKSINKILYGPPGTGKTFTLKENLFPKYTSRETSITKEVHFENIVKNCPWWQVIAVALLELGPSKVGEIYEHSWVQMKVKLSNSNTVRPTLWGQLQSHTIEECSYVNVSKKLSPLIFNKQEDSTWEIVNELVDDLVPELRTLLESVNNYQPNPDNEVRHYKFVTFHQSFAYEDFVEGIKPILPEEDDVVSDLGYTIEPGVFMQICRDAEKDPANRYAIFIDEINRGNVSAIFGELITLIEPDKRQGCENEIKVVLPYSKKLFSVPSNLDIYGTMNTADRSVEALDTALRRRFTFKEIMPNPYLLEDKVIGDIKLSEVLETINQRVELLIDRDHTIGHSYFINVNDNKDLALTFNDKIIPLLQEYFYGDYGKIGLVLGKGFVNKKNNNDKKFATFQYDGQSDFKTPSFELIKATESNIVESIEILLNRNIKENTDNVNQ